jgi:uncharacterized protein (TIGR02246 family)
MREDEEAIRALIAEWMRASQAGDTQKVLSLMTDDVVFLIAGRPPMRKSDFAASQAALRDVEMKTTGEVQELNVCGDWAYLWTKLSVTMTPRDGAPVNRTGNTLSILRKQNGRWLMFRDANLLAQVKS